MLTGAWHTLRGYGVVISSMARPNGVFDFQSQLWFCGLAIKKLGLDFVANQQIVDYVDQLAGNPPGYFRTRYNIHTARSIIRGYLGL